MNAAKKIRRFIEENQDPEQVQVLKDLAAALEMGRSFDLGSLYQIDMRYFEVALDLLKDWRFDHHIAARSKLLEQLLTEIAPDLRADTSSTTPAAVVETSAEAAEASSPEQASKGDNDAPQAEPAANSKPATSRRRKTAAE
ncbi:hypothetical protein [Aquitalea sp. LB_tupeE]|uniref:hypothetical protein n=1 Tax=Aquitalea sp. LB_tupeE TaxID=2748078 RepID=UPI0015BD2B32|nr:hypothetical protein [Aquitalea sp. LB_tupeE]NWK76371.1 hypothetical protein [Aquitalea sp. LB_tupeE]